MASLILASLVVVANAKSFLQVEVSAKSIENALLSELSGIADAAQLDTLRGIEEELAPMYASLPKNSHGTLDSATVRYALHRYFMRKHGWYVNGLGPVSNISGQSMSSMILKERAPMFIQNIFEQRLQGKGLGHHDLAVFAATVTDLIHSEVIGSLTSIYEALELPTRGPLTHREYQMANQAYLLTYLSGGDVEFADQDELVVEEREWAERYLAWEDTSLWFADSMLTYELSRQTRMNPFKQRKFHSFEDQVPFLQEVGHRLGTFQNLECHRLKDTLVDMEDVGTGRVPLSRFYSNGLAGKWEFTESVEYLRHIGALDDRDPTRMSVVIPNYIQSEANCLAGSSFYSVCCFDECESLMGQLERAIEGSLADPAHVAAAISSVSSDTVLAPRNLSVGLQTRLEEIAHLHGGTVPLHGRLFAQWMHHAYPRECRFPHVMGAENRMSPHEWMEAMDLEVEASEEDMAVYVNYDEHSTMTDALKGVALPWSMTEELIAGHVGHKADARHPVMSLLRIAVAMSVLASFAMPMAWGSTVARGSEKRAECFV